MDIRSFALDGPLEIYPVRRHDTRGYFAEIFREDLFCAAAGPVHFVQENESRSGLAGTVRGLHFQADPMAQGKLVRCSQGVIFDVAVDLRPRSPSFGQWVTTELSAAKGNQLWVPAGFAHGFCTLVPDCITTYKVTQYYSPEHDKGLAWDDPDLAIGWPTVANPATLAAKDRAHPRLANLPRALFTKG